MNITHDYQDGLVTVGVVLPSADCFVTAEMGKTNDDGLFELTEGDRAYANMTLIADSQATSIYGHRNIAALWYFLTAFLMEFDEYASQVGGQNADKSEGVGA